MSLMTDRVDFYKDVLGEWRWRYVRVNGRAMADSGEGYHNRADCVAAAEYLFGKRDGLTYSFEIESKVEGD